MAKSCPLVSEWRDFKTQIKSKECVKSRVKYRESEKKETETKFDLGQNLEEERKLLRNLRGIRDNEFRFRR